MLNMLQLFINPSPARGSRNGFSLTVISLHLFIKIGRIFYTVCLDITRSVWVRAMCSHTIPIWTSPFKGLGCARGSDIIRCRYTTSKERRPYFRSCFLVMHGCIPGCPMATGSWNPIISTRGKDWAIPRKHFPRAHVTGSGGICLTITCQHCLEGTANMARDCSTCRQICACARDLFSLWHITGWQS